MYTYNLCWPVRTLRIRGPDGQWLPRSPAMAADLTDHVWSIREWLTYPVVQLMLRVPGLRHFWEYSTLTRIYRRYHEPDTPLSVLAFPHARGGGT